jgi:arginyl-tRNA synthetase
LQPPQIIEFIRVETLKQYLTRLLETALEQVSGLDHCNANVITTSKPEHGDYQANGVMALAKQLKINPRELAQQVVQQLELSPDPLIEHLQVAGPGFINIHLANSQLLQRGSAILQDPATSIPLAAVPDTIVVDHWRLSGASNGATGPPHHPPESRR